MESSNSLQHVTSESQPIKINLADGTIVWLAWGSSFSYPHVFHEGTREVVLNGEARFEVAADPAKPFVIKSKTSETLQVEGNVTVRVVAGEIESVKDVK